jgi:hypothetical protein
MKRHADMDIREWLKGMSQQGSVSVVGREASSVELAEATAALREAMTDYEKIRTLCVGCGQDAPLLECEPCECGGFVCAPCRKVETEGECHHDVPRYAEED